MQVTHSGTVETKRRRDADTLLRYSIGAYLVGMPQNVMRNQRNIYYLYKISFIFYFLKSNGRANWNQNFLSESCSSSFKDPKMNLEGIKEKADIIFYQLQSMLIFRQV